MVNRIIKKLTDILIKLYLKWVDPVTAQIDSSVRFVNKPIIKTVKGTKLYIGKNVTINSDKINYHLNMFSPCKIILNKTGGEIIIGDNTRIHGTCIHAYGKISIGKNCLIAANTQIMDNNGHHLSFENVSNRIYTRGNIKPVEIEDNVWIGTNVIILPGVRIGEGSVISANSVVKGNIPPKCLAGGNPAAVIKQF